jgi:hypothetical protein
MGLCGSLRVRSSNRALLFAARKHAPAGMDVAISESIQDLPHFNPDIDGPARDPEDRLTDISFRSGRNVMDEDLNQMSREELIAEVMRLRQGVRQHRDSSRHELCWHHPSLWGLLPEKTDPIPVVPEWPEFMRGCVTYRQSLDEQAPNAPRTNEPYEK